MITEHILLMAAMVCLIVGPTFIVHLLHRRAEKRRAADRRQEEAEREGQRRRRGRICDHGTT